MFQVAWHHNAVVSQCHRAPCNTRGNIAAVSITYYVLSENFAVIEGRRSRIGVLHSTALLQAFRLHCNKWRLRPSDHGYIDSIHLFIRRLGILFSGCIISQIQIIPHLILIPGTWYMAPTIIVVEWSKTVITSHILYVQIYDALFCCGHVTIIYQHG